MANSNYRARATLPPVGGEPPPINWDMSPYEEAVVEGETTFEREWKKLLENLRVPADVFRGDAGRVSMANTRYESVHDQLVERFQMVSRYSSVISAMEEIPPYNPPPEVGVPRMRSVTEALKDLKESLKDG